MRDLADLLDLRFEYLSKNRETDRFLRQLRIWEQSLWRDQRIATMARDLEREGLDLIEAHLAYDKATTSRLAMLRARFGLLAPSLDDGNVPRPADPDPDWETTLAYFDETAKRPWVAPEVSLQGADSAEDKTRAGGLLALLMERVHCARVGDNGPGPFWSALEPLSNELRAVKKAHEAHHHAFTDGKLTSAGIALIHLREALQDIRVGYGGLVDTISERRIIPVEGFNEAAKWLYGNRDSSNQSKQVRALKKIAEYLWTCAERIHVTLQSTIGSRASLATVFDRFKHRCEWHDRARLLDLAQASTRPEDTLGEQLALFLFDQGLSPLTRPMMGGLSPDIADPSRVGNLYVEAKQYDRPRKAYLIKGMHQLRDTVGRLSGTPYEVTEAFYVVFRRGGPRYELPTRLRLGPLTVFVRLIDLAPASISGSRQKNAPVAIAEDDLIVHLKNNR